MMVSVIVSLSGLRDAQQTGKTVFLGLSVRVLLEDISICVGRLSAIGRPY